MDLDRRTMELLRPAAERLRKVLQRMDDEDVPAPLRRLAESSDRRLPPPILKRALAELDTSEWLRDPGRGGTSVYEATCENVPAGSERRGDPGGNDE